MIESITISSLATYDTTPEQLNGLSKFNFLFGSNGTGKTTIGRVIADEAKFPTCKVTWKAGTKLQPFVYNHDFVERNFNQSPELKGVFTLGEKQLDTLATVSYTHLRAHETVLDLVCRLLLEKKKHDRDYYLQHYEYQPRLSEHTTYPPTLTLPTT